MHWLAILLLNLLVQNALAAPRGQTLMATDLLSGKTISVESKSLVVTFLSSKCPCSNSHTGELAALAREYPAYKFVAIHSNTEESAEDAKVYFKFLNFTFPVLRDGEQKIANLFKATKTPHSFVLNEKGEVVYQGGISSSKEFVDADHKYLREALQDLNLGRTIRTPQARTLGCAISRI